MAIVPTLRVAVVAALGLAGCTPEPPAERIDGSGGSTTSSGSTASPVSTSASTTKDGDTTVATTHAGSTGGTEGAGTDGIPDPANPLDCYGFETEDECLCHAECGWPEVEVVRPIVGANACEQLGPRRHCTPRFDGLERAFPPTRGCESSTTWHAHDRGDGSYLLVKDLATSAPGFEPCADGTWEAADPKACACFCGDLEEPIDGLRIPG